MGFQGEERKKTTDGILVRCEKCREFFRIEPKFKWAITGEYLKEFEKIDTGLAEKYSDEQLIDFIRCIPVCAGWGLLAELLKRYTVKKEGE
ncbi:MAG: hypothetical protein GY861_02940 [bacterium]|nr:hypothetical protein [bacterium]